MKLLPQGGGVAPLACLSKFVTSETAALIQLRLESVAAVDESVYRVMASWALVVAPLARISLMTHGAVQAIHSRHSPVKVVAPSDRVRFGTHD
jgi:hypothetical protein